MQLIEKGYRSDIINICSTDHPTKEAYYTYLCSQFKIQKPEFQISNKVFKLVCNKKLREKYGFTFKYNSPLGFKFS